MKSKRNWLIIGLVIVFVVVFAAFVGFNHKPQVQYFTTKVDQGDIHEEVQATGTINAVTTVQVGSQVSGTIDKLFVDFNSHVTKDQIIAVIEPSLFQGALLQAQADLENAKANLASSKANLEKSKAMAQQAQADYARSQGLTKEGVISQQQLDLAKATAESATAQVSSSQAQVTQADAQVKQKAAAVSVAQTNLNHTIIRAPIDGVVVARNVDKGQTVAASLQAPTLFTIAQDLTKMQVYVKTDESDVGGIKVGKPVRFTVDAFPRDTFSGTVSQVRMNATTVQNVVTYDSIVDFANPDLKLFPGMTAYVTIPVATAQDVAKVPNGALRFKPSMSPDEIRALYKKYGLDSGGGQQAAGGQPATGDQQASGAQPVAGATGGQQASAGAGQPGQARSRNRQAGGGAEPTATTPGGSTEQAPRLGQNQGLGGVKTDVAVVWKLAPDKSIIPVRLRTGITDHTYTQVIKVMQGDLKPGDDVVTGSTAVARPATAAPGIGGGARR